MKAWTDYPFVELGDQEYQKAPVREVRVIDYDGNKYCHIEVAGVISEVKIGYLYRKPGRCREVPCIDEWKLRYPDGTPYWKRNARRVRKTTWVVQLAAGDLGGRRHIEKDTLVEALRVFNASPVGTLLTRSVSPYRIGQSGLTWERVQPQKPYAHRVKKQRRGRK
jgi:hypothetical protein